MLRVLATPFWCDELATSTDAPVVVGVNVVTCGCVTTGRIDVGGRFGSIVVVGGKVVDDELLPLSLRMLLRIKNPTTTARWR